MEMAEQSSTPSVSAEQIPNLLKIGAVPVNTAMEVTTTIIDPVVQNQRFIRFTIPPTGILHSHSKIQFAFADQVTASYVPINVGIAALIQRATLKVGNQTVCEIDDFSHFTAYRSMFMANETSRERLQYQTGQMMSKEFMYAADGETRVDVVPDVYGGGASSTLAETIGVSNGMSYNADGGPAALNTAQRINTPQYLDLVKADTNTNPTFQWSLSDFFPFLKINQLPLYMMKEQVNLEFVLTQSGDAATVGERVIVENGAAAGGTYDIDPAKTQMICDHIYYPQEMMLSYQQANPKLNFSYVDYRLSKMTFDAGVSTGNQIRNVGGAGRLVSKVVWGMSNNWANSQATFFGTNDAQGVDRTYTDPPVFGDTQGTLTTNVKYNDRFVYPIDVDNNSRHFHNVVQSEGLVPFVSREEYSNEGINLSGTRTLNGEVQQTFLGGKSNWSACALNRGERVNSRGIEIYFNYATLPVANTFTMRAYVETIRMATLENGYLTCYWA